MPANTSQKELLHLHTGSEEQNNQHSSNQQIINKEHVEGTGFDIIHYDQHGYWLVIGHYRVSETKKTKEELIKLIETKDWDLLIGVIGAAMQANQDQIDAQLIHSGGKPDGKIERPEDITGIETK